MTKLTLSLSFALLQGHLKSSLEPDLVLLEPVNFRKELLLDTVHWDARGTGGTTASGSSCFRTGTILSLALTPLGS